MGLKAVAKLAPVVIDVRMVANGENVDQNIFIADREYEVVEANESHATAGTDGGSVVLDIKKATGTTAIASGVTVLASTFDLKATANTVARKTRANGGILSTPVRFLSRGDRLGIDITGTITSLAGTVVTVVLQPTGKP